jgi:indole-3-glycerol phosphate synthase
LKTYKVDLGTTERLARRLRAQPGSQEKLIVAESGIRTGADVKRIADCGANAILVGESLMKQKDIPGKIRELLGCQDIQS